MDTIFWPLTGGVLIGLSAVLLLLAVGRIAGISGLVWGAMAPVSRDRAWRMLFLVGLIVGAYLFHALSGVAYPTIDQNLPLAAVAGLIVGLGVKIGNGCTSGHGVCGIGRLSKRSLVATITFMLVAIMVVAVTRQLF